MNYEIIYHNKEISGRRYFRCSLQFILLHIAEALHIQRLCLS